MECCLEAMRCRRLASEPPGFRCFAEGGASQEESEKSRFSLHRAFLDVSLRGRVPEVGVHPRSWAGPSPGVFYSKLRDDTIGKACEGGGSLVVVALQ